MAVSRLLTLMMMFMIVVAPSSSVAAAICRHQSPVEHTIARASSDAKVSSVARTEESAASLFKERALSDAPSALLLAVMLSAARLTAPLRVAEPSRPLLLNENILPGTSVRPLLEPPST